MRDRLASFLQKRHSIRTRLMLWNVGTLSLILVLLGMTIRYSSQNYLLTSIDRELAFKTLPPSESNAIPPFLKYPPVPLGVMSVTPLSRIKARNQVLEESKRTEISYMPRVLNRYGEAIFPQLDVGAWDEEAFRSSLQGLEVYSTLQIGDDTIRVFSRPLQEEGKVIAVVQMPHPLTETYRVLRSVDRTLLTLIPLALVLAGCGGAILTQRALLPVRQIAETATQIGTRELSRRLPVQGEDEFSHLATTFNEMLERLQGGFERQQDLVGQLERIVEQQRRFTADASHELRTPLTIIKASASLTLQSQPSEADYREAMEEVNEAADAMGRLVQDLLLLARSDSGQIGRHSLPISLNEVLEAAVKRVQKPGIAPIFLEMKRENLMVEGHRDEILRVFSNLLENASRYTPSSGTIQVVADRHQKGIVILVKDTGIGIPAEHLPHLGERFYRVDASRSRPDGGTGLGLAICQSILSAYQGAMTIESEFGRGTLVTVLFPAP